MRDKCSSISSSSSSSSCCIGPTGPRGFPGRKGLRGNNGPTGPIGDTGAGGSFCQQFEESGLDVGDIVTFGKDNAINPELHELIVERWHWNASIDSTGPDTNPAIVTDKCGNIYVVGSGANGVPPGFFDAGNIGGANLFGHTGINNEVYIGKINSDGQWLWTAAVDSDSDDTLPKVATDHCGNVYVVGQANGTPLFYNADDTQTISGKTLNDTTQVFVGKINPDGVWQWAAAIDETSSTPGQVITPDIATDSCGNVYVVAQGVVITDEEGNATVHFYDALTTTGSTNPVSSLDGKSASSNYICIGKIDRNGIWVWAAQIDTASTSGALDPVVATDCSGNAYIAGWGADTDPPLYYGPNSTGNVDSTVILTGRANGTATHTQIFLGKIDPLGLWLWSASIGDL